MEAFNIQAGVALQNAKLFSTVKQQQQEQLDLVFNVSSGVIFTDKTGHITLTNEPAKYLLGLSDIAGQSVRDLIRLQDSDFAQVSGTLVIINDSSDEKQKQEQHDLVRRMSSGVIFEEPAGD